MTNSPSWLANFKQNEATTIDQLQNMGANLIAVISDALHAELEDSRGCHTPEQSYKHVTSNLALLGLARCLTVMYEKNKSDDDK